MKKSLTLGRRPALKLIGASLASVALGPIPVLAREEQPLMKAIPSTGEQIPAIGMGTWRTFNVGRGRALRDARTEVLKALFDHGGGMIDSSPMYGSAQSVLGYGLRKLGMPEGLFSADKVWTWDSDATRTQTAETRRLWGVQRFDLMQIHNLVSWEAHLETLKAMKSAGELRYLGVTTSHGRRHGELEQIMQREPLDFVQLTYNLTHRAVENRLLPLAQERGIAVIANRPFDGGHLVKGLQRRNHPLPAWASEIGATHWPAFLLNFIVSHPALTCAIPATTQVQHMHENKEAELGPLPDAKMRERMIRYVESL